MAVEFKTDKPEELLKKFDARIAQTAKKGSIETWEKRGDRYTHKAAEWANKAFFKAKVEVGLLRFAISKPEKGDLLLKVYAYYHGHLIETFINHFSDDFTQATAKPI